MFNHIRAAMNIAILPLILMIALFFLFMQSPTEENRDLLQPNLDRAPWEVFFSDPTNPLAGTYKGGPDEFLVESLDNAQFSIDVAIYRLDLWNIRDAIIRAKNRGVDIRIVVDDVNADEAEISVLKREGIEIVTDQSRNLMHHKFVLIDRIEVWTGSMNFTVNGAYRNDNNLIRFRDRNLAENYLREFEEMFIQRRFGAASLTDTPHPRTYLGNVEVETFFSPDDGAVFKIVDLINGAKTRVDVLAYTITSDPISNALLRAAERGILVRGVVEGSQINAMGSDVSAMISSGLDLRLDGNPNSMHHKVIIIDSSLVLLGSYNFTRSAEENNDENMMIVHDPALAEQFLIEFDRLFTYAHNLSN